MVRGTLLNPTSGSLKRDPIDRVYIPTKALHPKPVLEPQNGPLMLNPFWNPKKDPKPYP